MTLESNSRQTDEFINGAAILGAGRTLGFSDDETIAVKRANQRREQRARREQRSSREGNRAAAEEFLAQDDASFKQKAQLTDSQLAYLLNSQTSVDIDDEAWAFGEDPDAATIGRPQDDGQSYTREEKVRNDVLGSDFLTAAEVEEQTEGRSRPTSGAAGMRDALTRLQQADKQYGYAAFGEEGEQMAAIDRRLSESIDSKQQRSRDRGEAQKAVLDDARRRRGDLTDAEIAYAVDRTVANADLNRNEVIAGQEGSPRAQLTSRITQELEGRRSDGQSGGPEMRALIQEAKAAKEADVIRNRLGGLPRQLADEDIGRINEVIRLGGVGKASHDPNFSAPGSYQVIQREDPSTFGTAIPLRDKDGSIREYYGYENKDLVQLGVANVDSTDQVLNAVKPTPGQSWVAGNLPDYAKPGGTTFGYPQVSIGEEMAMLGDRVRGLPGYGYEGVGNPRTVAEFEQMMGAVAARSAKLGKSIFSFDADSGKQVVVPNPGVDDILGTLGYSDGEKARLANALFQSQAAQVVDVNQSDKQAYAGRRPQQSAGRNDIAFNSEEMRTDGGLTLDKVGGNQKVGKKNVRAGLRGITGDPIVESLKESGELLTRGIVGTDRAGNPKYGDVLLPEAARAIVGATQARGDAQMPLYGNVAGDNVDKVRYIRGNARNQGEAALIERYGPAQGMAAAETERRFKEDERLRAEKASQTTDPIAVEQRRRDSQIEGKKAQMQYDDEVREKDEIIKLIKRGATQPGGFDLGQTIGGRPRVIEAAPAGRKLQVPSDEAFGGRTPIMVGKGNKREPLSVAPGFQRQVVQEAAVTPSIAPDPGAGTGNQARPMVDAGGGGMRPPTRTAIASPAPEPRREVQSFGSVGSPVDEIKRIRATRQRSGAPSEGPTMDASGKGRTMQQRADAVLNSLTKATGYNVRETGRDLENIRTNPKYKNARRGAAAGGVGLAALGTILNLRDNEEEAEMMQ